MYFLKLGVVVLKSFCSLRSSLQEAADRKWETAVLRHQMKSWSWHSVQVGPAPQISGILPGACCAHCRVKKWRHSGCSCHWLYTTPRQAQPHSSTPRSQEKGWRWRPLHHCWRHLLPCFPPIKQSPLGSGYVGLPASHVHHTLSKLLCHFFLLRGDWLREGTGITTNRLELTYQLKPVCHP